MAIDVAPGTIVIFSDLACPWSSLAVNRLRERRTALGLDEAVRLDHRAFPLEIVNGRSPSKDGTTDEIKAIAKAVKGLGWHGWSGREHFYPASTLLALEAVQAAKVRAVGGLRGSEDLDAALRDAFYRDSRPIGLHTEIVAIAAEVETVDEVALAQRLRAGRSRTLVFADAEIAQTETQGAPHLFLPDGTDVHNPAVEFTMKKPKKKGGRPKPKVTSYRPEAYDVILQRAAGGAGAEVTRATAAEPGPGS